MAERSLEELMDPGGSTGQSDGMTAAEARSSPGGNWTRWGQRPKQRRRPPQHLSRNISLRWLTLRAGVLWQRPAVRGPGQTLGAARRLRLLRQLTVGADLQWTGRLITARQRSSWTG
ncbi:Hypothetical predicted protein [Pelobates cultripes]|uniref:Uncharacterized protein n=1 Tax=Pelobates cultripes TaxID=61616 RepID=A0AAD1R293_PELCU|nr:Hypothetical predicted protein [Pelobates cultripes]